MNHDQLRDRLMKAIAWAERRGFRELADGLEDMRREVEDDAADALLARRDPYAYHGVRASDFM